MHLLYCSHIIFFKRKPTNTISCTLGFKNLNPNVYFQPMGLRIESWVLLINDMTSHLAFTMWGYIISAMFLPLVVLKVPWFWGIISGAFQCELYQIQNNKFGNISSLNILDFNWERCGDLAIRINQHFRNSETFYFKTIDLCLNINFCISL